MPPTLPDNKFVHNKFVHRRRVEFRDTDMAGIVHFSVFFAYMEQAEHEFLRHIGTGVISELDGHKLSWPRVNANCNYRKAIRYDDIVDVEVSVLRIGNKSVSYGFQLTCDERLIAEGEITAACCLFEQGQAPQPVAVPQSFRDRLAPYVAQGSQD